MAQTSHSRDTDLEGAPPTERLPIYLRGYAHQPPRPATVRRDARLPPGPLTLIFDTETTTDAAQRLRIGSYQLLEHGVLEQQGLFFDPDALDEDEVACLRLEARRCEQSLLTLKQFVEHLVFGVHANGGTIVGFNLPFDLSRLARGWSSARGTMRGGFSFSLSSRSDRPRLRIKHLSRRAAFIDFAAPGKQEVPRSARKRGETVPIERGTFLDLATLGAALTGQTHSLKSLAQLLGTQDQKSEGGDYGRKLDPTLIAYAINDTQVTRECWEGLLARYAVHAATEKPAYAIYSEASLGKAYLEAMGVQPWRAVQPDFDPALTGAIMSAYYGGRAEVHVRREVVRTIYCDFASMYPTVCTLMGLWRFVIARGVQDHDATDEVRAFLAEVDAETLQDPACWPSLSALVEVEPVADIFPVRARYGDEPVATIGVNYLTSERPLWFTLADCVASKLLTGRPPRVRRAIRFAPMTAQDSLRPVPLAGDKTNSVDPLTDDFYRRVIDLRRLTKRLEKAATNAGEKAQLDAHQFALKILANATSYGIFIEVNVEELLRPEVVALFEGERQRDHEVHAREEPGTYFHPLLATLITGAARLLLAITERKLLDAGLDWAFCDTDSMAFAKPDRLDEAAFEQRVREVCAWFKPLDPFADKGEVLEIEGQNFSPDPAHRGMIEPLFCYAVSSKRYALFNRAAGGEPVIRKASGHGLGHLLAPYDDPGRERHATGVPVWQEDFWREIVKAALAGTPDRVRRNWRPEMAAPAASQYAATTPVLLRSMSAYNETRPLAEQVRPFNFMLWFHALRPEEAAAVDDAVDWTKRMRTPKPAAPYDRKPGRAAGHAFDRDTGEAVGRERLKSYDHALRTYARHPETKFLGGDYGERGMLHRRHVLAGLPIYIGKEADRWEEDEEFGANEASVVSYGLGNDARAETAVVVRAALALKGVTHKKLAQAAKISEHTVKQALDGGVIEQKALARLAAAAERLRSEAALTAAGNAHALETLRRWVEANGIAAVADRLAYRVENLRKVLAGTRNPSRALLTAMRRVRAD